VEDATTLSWSSAAVSEWVSTPAQCHDDSYSVHRVTAYISSMCLKPIYIYSHCHIQWSN